MKKSLKKAVSLILSMLIMSSLSCAFAQTQTIAAEGTIVIDYTRETGSVIISGTAQEGTNIEEPARLLILKPGTDNSSLESGAVDFTTVGIHVDEAVISSDLSYTFEEVFFPATLPAGDYIVRVATGENVVTELLPFASEEQVLSMLDNVQNASDMGALIEKYNDVYGLDLSEDGDYALLADAGKQYVLEKMCSKDYTGADDIKNTFDKYTQLYRIYEGPWGVAKAVIETHSSLLGLDLTAYNNAGNAKTDICKALVGKVYADESELKTALDVAVTENAGSGSDRERPSGSGGGASGNISMQIAVPKNDENNGNENVNDAVKPNSSEPFSDLAGYEWAKDSIYELYSKGIVSGKAQGVFAPQDAITRAEAVKMAVLALSEVDYEALNNFLDVQAGSWMEPFVATASSKGFVTGYSEEIFGPSDLITREDFATIIVRAAESCGITFDEKQRTRFADEEEIADYAIEAIYKLKAAGIINGVGENMFMPKANTTRAEAAKIIAALI